MAAPTTQTHGGMRGALDPELYDINEDEWAFFSAWTKIEDRKEFKALVMDVQKRTYAIVSHVRRRVRHPLTTALHPLFLLPPCQGRIAQRL